MGDQNPWVVENIEVFSFYCCPECDFKSKDREYFKKHVKEKTIQVLSLYVISNALKRET